MPEERTDQVGRVAGQEVQRELALAACDIGLHGTGLVRRPVVQDQVQRPALTAHQAPQEGHEPVAVQAALVGGEAERPLGTDRRRGTDALAEGRAELRTPPAQRDRRERELATLLVELDRLIALVVGGRAPERVLAEIASREARIRALEHELQAVASETTP